MAAAEKPKAAKQARLGLRVSEEHKTRIERAAAMTGQTVNSFAASELLKRSDEILEREEVRRLSDRDRDIFLALLEADGEPNEALKAAVKEYNTGRHVGAKYYFKA